MDNHGLKILNGKFQKYTFHKFEIAHRSECLTSSRHVGVVSSHIITRKSETSMRYFEREAILTLFYFIINYHSSFTVPDL